MMITCKEYNRRWKEKGFGYVLRNIFGKWAVCDGLAPDSDVLVSDKAVFCGYIVKTFDTYQEAAALRKILNA